MEVNYSSCWYMDCAEILEIKGVVYYERKY